MEGSYLSNGATVPTFLTELRVVGGWPFREIPTSRTRQGNARSQSLSDSSLGSSTRDHPVSMRAWCAAPTSDHQGAKLCSDACRRVRRIQHVRRYQNAHPEKKRDNERRWKAANPDKVSEYTRRYREANRDKKRKLNRQYYFANRDQIRERKRMRRIPIDRE